MPDTEGNYDGFVFNGWDYSSDNEDNFYFRHDGNVVATISKYGGEWHGNFMGTFGIVAPEMETVFRAIQGKLIEYGY